MEQLSQRFNIASKIILYVMAALIPLWAVPLSLPIEFGREVTFIALATAVFVLQLLIALRSGEIGFVRSPVLYAGGLFLLIYSISAFFSKSSYVSLFFSEASAEKLSTLILGVVLLLLTSTVFRSVKEVGVFVFILSAAGGMSALIALIGSFGYLPEIVGRWLPVANMIGTINGLGLFYLALLLVNIGLLFSGAFGWLKAWTKVLLCISSLLFFVMLLAINFQTVWAVLIGSSIFLFGLIFEKVRGGSHAFGWRHWAVLVLIVFAVVMLMVRTAILPVSIPVEVNPSLRATLGIVRSTFGEGVDRALLGSGPGTFGMDWGLYKDSSINQTIFWALRFAQGYSWASTLLATAGILGFLSFLGFIGISVFVFLRRLLFSREDMVLERALFLGIVSLVLSSFLYPANFTMTLLLFILMGLLLALMGERGEGEEKGFWKGFWDVKRVDIKFESPWALFLVSLASIFFVSLGIATLYLEATAVRAALIRVDANKAISNGNIPEVVKNLERAVALDSQNPQYHQALALARLDQIREIINRAGRGQNVQNEFQSVVSTAIQNIQTAVSLYPQESSFWRIQGTIYETIIPFIPGSEKFSFDSYKKAAELEPKNPAILTDLGRAYMVFAERQQLNINQGQGDRRLMEQARDQALTEAQAVLQKAAEIKPDFATAHFLLTQVAVRRGDIQTAIRSAEQAKLVAPLDIGVAFQLGLLYYQTNDLRNAEAEFSRALSMNEDYSNARYFLGLIYDRRGQKTQALDQFERIKLFNPDNQEVDKIIANIKANKRALAGIAPAPEDRRETPVK